MNTSRLMILSILVLVSGANFLTLISASKVPTADGFLPAPADSKHWDNHDYRTVLRYVNEAGMVHYGNLKRNREALDSFALRLGTLSKATYDLWDENEKISFWLNAYNGLTLLAIVNNYPIEASFFRSLRYPKNSIRQISGVWESITFQIMGQPATLDEIEHQILRKQFADPRIHFALVCAAMGCPPLRNEPYEGNRLDEQLDDQARRFFGNPDKFRIDRRTNTVYLSGILDWFAEDFMSKSHEEEFEGGKNAETAITAVVSRYVSPEDAEYLRNRRYSIRYLDYDWSLNEQKPD